MTHALWTTIAKVELALEMIKAPPTGDTVDAIKASVLMMHGQAENALNAVKDSITKFIHDDEARTAAAAAASAVAALPVPVPVPVPTAPAPRRALPRMEPESTETLDEKEKLAERIFVQLQAKHPPIENPAGHAVEQAEAFFRKLAEVQNARK